MFDPVSLGISAVGVGLQLYSGFKQSEQSKEIAQLSQQKAAEEQAINRIKLQQMEVEGRRMQLETIRNTQRARALSLSSAVTQGAEFGTGLLGGQAEIQNKGAWNLQGVDFGLMFGRDIAARNDNISALNARIAGVSGEMAESNSYGSLGGALIKAGPVVGQLAGGFGSSSQSGDYSGMPWSKNTGGLY